MQDLFKKYFPWSTKQMDVWLDVNDQRKIIQAETQAVQKVFQCLLIRLLFLLTLDTA